MTVLQTDVEALLGRDLTSAEQDRFDRLVEMAEARLGAILPGFSVAEGTVENEVIHHGDPDVMWTARYPVVAVSSLAFDGQALDDSDYIFDQLGRIRLARSGELNAWEINLASVPYSAVATVSYSYGLAPVPADIAEVVAEDVASRLRRQASNPGNVVQESIGSYSVTYPTERGESEAEARALQRWKRNRQSSVPLVRYR